jgi:hypothetical protein
VEGVVKRTIVLVALCALVEGCGSSGASSDVGPAPSRRDADTSGAGLIPAGYGSLRQEEISVRIQLPSLLVRAIPLDESIIRVLSPDSYSALHELVRGRSTEIATLAGRHGVRTPSLWYISFYGLEHEARFDPQGVVITGGGRDYRALEIVPLTGNFSSPRIRQRETHSAIYLFDDGLDANQPVVVAIDTVRNATWGTTLRAIERERALVRSRAAQGPRPQPTSTPRER